MADVAISQEPNSSGRIYFVLQHVDRDLTLSPESLTETVKYVGKNSNVWFRYFNNDNQCVTGRIGDELRKAIDSRTKTYFWPCFQSVSRAHYGAIEHALIISGFHIDFGHSPARLWDLDPNALPDVHIWRELDPKTVIKIGLILWRKVIEKFNEHVKTDIVDNFQSVPELLDYFDKLAANDQERFRTRCREGDGKTRAHRLCQRKTPLESSTGNKPTSSLADSQHAEVETLRLQIAGLVQQVADRDKTIDSLQTLLTSHGIAVVHSSDSSLH